VPPQQQEAELTAEILQRALSNTTNFASIAIDTHGSIQVFNVGAERMLGYQAAEAIHKITLADISYSQEIIARAERLSAEFGTHIAPDFNALIFKASRGIEDSYELTFIRKDGSRFSAVVSVTALRDEKDTIIGYLLIGTDNTVRKQVEAEQMVLDQRLRDQQFYTRSLIESNIDALMTTDAKGIISDVNKQMEALTGCTRDELIGAPFKNYFTDPARAEAGIKKVLAEGEVTDYELTALSWNGKQTVVSYNASTFYDRDRKLQGVFAAARDVTERNLLTVELENAKIIAEKASLSKSDFLSNMSHEIRTPMNSIIGMSLLALKTELTTRQRDYIKKIQGSGQYLISIINDILDFSKIEAGKLSIENTELNLEEVLENLANLIAPQTAVKGLELVFDVDPDVPNKLIGDPLRLGQILINYANNAVKFTETGEIVIVIRLYEESDTGILLHCTVRDTGIGITSEQCGQLFLPFQQADTSTTRKYGGTGLGLVISKRLAELMQGEVGVESEYGQGSSFWFTARLSKDISSKHPQTVSSDMQGKRMLVVDDNDYARAVLKKLLESMSFVVDEAASGQLAVEAVIQAEVQGTPFSIVFIDSQMPGMDGSETMRQLHTHSYKNLPHIIMVTTYGDEKVIKDAEEAGLKDVIVKPVGLSVLFDSVTRLLSGHSAQQVSSNNTSLSEANLASAKGAHILLVEDNKINQEVASELLRYVGFIVDLAENGEIAVRKVQETLYDLVLMDMQMPVMDGITATKEIRKLPQFSQLPIVAMTANAMAADRQRCLDAGMNDHIPKPVEPENLWKVLLKWIKSRNRLDQKLPATNVLSPRQCNSRSTNITVTTSGNHTSEVALHKIPVDLLGLKSINARDGIRRFGGKVNAYQKQLQRFSSHYQRAADKLQDLITEKGVEAGEIFCHELKGVCGTLGADDMFAYITELDDLLKQGKTPTQTQFNNLQNLLKQLIDEINELTTPDLVEAFPVVTLARDALILKLATLATLLESDMVEANSLLAELRAGVVDGKTEQALAEIAANIDAFAIDDALAKIDKLRALLRADV
jgi:PAS domain S-box-containing protein